MDGYDHVNGYALGASLGTDEVEAKEVSDFVASVTNNLDLDLDRVLVYETDLGPAEQQNNKSGGTQQGAVEFIDFSGSTEDEASATLDPKAAIAKSEIADQIDLYDPVDTEDGDDFDFDMGGDLSADDLGMFSILSSHLEDDLEDDDKDLDKAYDEEVISAFSEVYDKVDATTIEALNEGTTMSARSIAQGLFILDGAKEMVGAGAE